MMFVASTIRKFSQSRKNQRLLFQQFRQHSSNNEQQKSHEGGSIPQSMRVFYNKVMDNPLPLGAGALVVGILQWKRIKEREEERREQI